MIRAIVTAASILLISAGARDVCSVLVGDGAAPSEIEIAALRRNGPESRLAIRSLIADGRLMRWTSAAGVNGWTTGDQGGMPGPAIYASGFEPAHVRFRAATFVAVLNAQRWAGVVQFKRDGRTVQLADIASTEDSQSFVFGDPDVRPSWGVYATALALLAACAAWFGPVRPQRSGAAWVVFHAALLHGLVWAGQCVGTNNDTPAYLDGGLSLLAGMPDYFPPGYPAVLLVFSKFSGDRLGAAVTLFQHAALVIAGLWLYRIARRILPEDLAFAAAILASSLAPLLSTAQALMSEAPTCFALTGTLYFALRSDETRRTGLAAVAGAFAGWAGLIRVVPFAIALPAACFWRRKGRVFAAVTLGFALLPLLWFGLRSGRLNLTSSTGNHLYNRVLNEQKLVDRDGPATRRLMAAMAGKDPLEMPWWEVCRVESVRDLPAPEQERLLRDAALEGIRRDPVRYLLYTPRLAWRMFLAPADWIAPWSETIPEHPRMENPPPVPFTASGLRWRRGLEDAHRRAWPLLCWSALAGVLLGLSGRDRGLILLLAWIPAAYLLASASVEHFAPRYNATVCPFIAILAVVPAVYARIGLRELSKAGRAHLPVPAAGPMTPSTLIAIFAIAVATFQAALVWLAPVRAGRDFAALAASIVQLAVAGAWLATGRRRTLLALAIHALFACHLVFAFGNQWSTGPTRLVQLATVLTYVATAVSLLLRPLRVPLPRAAAIAGSAALLVFAIEANLGPGEPAPAGAVFVSKLTTSMRPDLEPSAARAPRSEFAVFYSRGPDGSLREQDPRLLSWQLRVAAGNRARLVLPPSASDALRVEIESRPSKALYDVQLNRPGYQVKRAVWYRVAFRARADAPRTATVGVARAHGAWDGLGLYQEVALTREWRNFDHRFAAAADDVNARILFDLGAGSIPVEIAGTELIELPEGRVLATPVPAGLTSIDYRFNQLGCRGADSPPDGPAAPIRILVLGGSAPLGEGIAEQSTFAYRLQRELNARGSGPWATMNCAAAGLGLQEAALFFGRVRSAFRPDLVLLTLSARDLPSFQRAPQGRPLPLFLAPARFREAVEPEDFSQAVSAIRRLDREARDTGSRLAVFLFRNNADPAGSTISSGAWKDLFRRLGDDLRKDGLPLLDFGEVLARAEPDLALSLHSPGDALPGEQAHAVAARALADWMLSGAVVLHEAGRAPH